VTEEDHVPWLRSRAPLFEGTPTAERFRAVAEELERLRAEVEKLRVERATYVELYRREHPEEYESAEVATWREEAERLRERVAELEAALKEKKT
jgi:uncharacterized protein YukE